MRKFLPLSSCKKYNLLRIGLLLFLAFQIKLAGAVNMPSTGSTSITTCSGTVYDDGGPSSNPTKNVNGSVLTIYPGTAGSKIELFFTEFSTASTGDFLEIFDGTSTSAPLIAPRFSEFDDPGVITATNSSGALTLRFTRGFATYGFPGFAATISCVTSASSIITVPYSGTQSVTACNGYIYDYSYGGYYGDYSSGTLTINPATAGSKVQLNFASFVTAGPGDYLAIYDGASTSSALLGTYTGEYGPGIITAMNGSGALTLKFVSDASGNTKGFAATIACVSSAILATVPVTGSSTVTGCSGQIYDNMGPSDYLNNSDGTLIIYPSTAGAQVQLNFSEFNTEPCCDYLQIYDGISTSFPTIGTYKGVTSPGTVTATNGAGALTLRFVSNSAGQFSGFAATVSCITIPKIDLVVSSQSISPTATAKGGSPITITSTINNKGNTPAPASNVGYYLSTNTTYDASDIYLGNSAVSSLAAGASSTVSYTFTIPASTAVGSYMILSRADDNGTVTETNETNNVSYSSLIVDAAKVDFIITSKSISPSTIPAGNPITVNTTIDNYGNSASPVSTIGYYISTKVVFDASAVLIGSSTVSSIAGYGSIPISSTVTIPATYTAGTYFFIYVIDYTKTVAESNENNNIEVSTLTVVTPTVDLIVLNQSVNPSSIAAGNPIVASSTIKNQGNSPAAASNVAYYLSTNTTFDGADVLLGTSPVSALAPSASSSISYSLSIPSATADGPYYILFKVDDNGVVSESDEANNIAYGSLIITAPINVDLIITLPSITELNVVESGSSVLASCTVFNVGTTTAPSSSVGYYLSKDETYDISDVYLNNSVGGALAANTGENKSVSLTIPSSTPTGNYYILFFADYNFTVTESQEFNNVANFPITITHSTTGIVNTIEGDVKVSPNPNDGRFTILANTGSDKLQISVYSPLGTEVKHINNANITTAIDLSEFAKGIYMVKVLDGEKQNFYRVVIE